MIKLGVNIDHVATVREARGTAEPRPLEAAKLAAAAGADAITVHLREDRRHIQDQDVRDLRAELDCRLNLETAATDEMLQFALEIHPACCCVVPEKRAELTTEGGLDVIANQATISSLCDRLGAAGIEVSLFIDPDFRQIEASRSCGAPTVEIHTGRYANAGSESRQNELEQVARAVEYARQCGIQANAGHGLDYQNVRAIADLKGINELNIGHSIVARSIFVGLSQAVSEMKALVSGNRP